MVYERDIGESLGIGGMIMGQELFKLNSGAVCLTISAPGGLFNPAQLSKIAEICAGSVEMGKATSDESIAVYVPESKVDEVRQELLNHGLNVGSYQIGLQRPISCLGSICPEAMQDALTTALDIDRECADIPFSTTVKIGINGCARSCVPNHTFDVALTGDGNGYRMSIGGKSSLIPEFAAFIADGVPSEQVAGRVASLLRYFSEQAQHGETMFEFLERAGNSEFVRIMSPYSQDAATGDDPFGNDSITEPAATESSDEEEMGEVSDDFSSELRAEDSAFAADTSEQEIPVAFADEEEMDAYEEMEVPLSELVSVSGNGHAASSVDIDDAPSQQAGNEDEIMLIDDEVSDGVSDIAVRENSHPSIAQLDEEILIDDQKASISHFGPKIDETDAELMDFDRDEVLIDADQEDLMEQEESLEMHEDEIRMESEPESQAPAQRATTIDTSADFAEDDQEQEAIALEADDAAAQAFEERLEEDLAVAEKLGDKQDENELARQETMEKIDDGRAFASSDLEEFTDEATDPYEEEDIGVQNLGDEFEPTQEQARDEPLKLTSVKPRSSSKAWQILAVKMNAPGVLSLVFDSGAEVKMKCDKFPQDEKRVLSLGDAQIEITVVAEGIDIMVDGIGFYLPHNVTNYLKAG
jgi:dissimilatory sulfite reductase (desulfoviridin) alpha/beta subunit